DDPEDAPDHAQPALEARDLEERELHLHHAGERAVVHQRARDAPDDGAVAPLRRGPHGALPEQDGLVRGIEVERRHLAGRPRGERGLEAALAPQQHVDGGQLAVACDQRLQLAAERPRPRPPPERPARVTRPSSATALVLRPKPRPASTIAESRQPTRSKAAKRAYGSRCTPQKNMLAMRVP